MRPRRPAERLGTDEGSTLPLVAGFAALAVAVVLVTAAASSLYLERKRLFTVADGAALAGAEAFDVGEVQVVGDFVVPRLTSDAVRRAVSDYLAQEPTTARSAIVLEQAGTPDGRSARVTLATRWSPPFLSALLPDGVTVRVTSTARSVFR